MKVERPKETYPDNPRENNESLNQAHGSENRVKREDFRNIAKVDKTLKDYWFCIQVMIKLWHQFSHSSIN